MRTQRGFTLIELLLVMSIMAILIGFITMNLVGSLQNASLTTTEEILITDLKQQQLKSMVGDTEGRSTSDSYGIHFEENSYVLFHGAVYSSGEASNSIINLDSNLQFNNPNFDIIFSKLSGTISGSLTFELQDNTNSRLKRIHLNRHGVVTGVD